MAVYLVTSADVGAPTLSGTNGDGVTVFDYILNTIGGLTIQNTATNKRNYVMPNGDILHCVHDNTVSGQAYLMVVRACESASAIDTLTDPYPLTTQVADNACGVRVSTTANGTTRAWWAVLDDSATTGCFYFFSDFASGDYTSGVWWAGGTQISCLPTDNYAAVMYSRNTTSTSTTGSISASNQFSGGISNGTVDHTYIKRSADGAIKSCLSAGTLVGGTSSANGFGSAAGPAAPSPIDGKIRQAAISMCDYYSATTTPGAGSEPMRLYLPRLFQPLHGVSGYGSIPCGTTWSDSAYGASAKFVFFKMGNNAGNNGGLIVQYDGTWTNPNG